MGRSLTIRKNEEDENSKSVGINYITGEYNTDNTYNITLKCEETEPKEYYIIVDGQNTNASFTIDSDDYDWLQYRVERFGYDNDGYVKLILQVDTNMDTSPRFCNIRLTHNCAPITMTISVQQEGTIYEIKAEKSLLIYNEIPLDGKKETQEVTIMAKGGNKKWYVKSITQYVCENSKENDTDNKDEITMPMMPIPFDNSLTYQCNGDKLIITSYGKVDMLPPSSHMEYYFLVCHKGINEYNKGYNLNKQYETNIIIKYN